MAFLFAKKDRNGQAFIAMVFNGFHLIQANVDAMAHTFGNFSLGGPAVGKRQGSTTGSTNEAPPAR